MPISLVYYGSPILRQKAEPIGEITDVVKELAREMSEWVRQHRGLGLAAPQVGYSWRLFVVCFPTYASDGRMLTGKEVTVFINPRLSRPSKELWTREEACFSIPGVYCPVSRPMHITVEAMDLEGNTFSIDLDGLPARIVMHENDHINGVLIVDRISAKERRAFDTLLRKIAKTHPPLDRTG
ncbi:MAG: peptide deformylase [Chlamydiales bacterium]|nr:peptide deformylase [Chlamydiales bacterium]